LKIIFNALNKEAGKANKSLYYKKTIKREEVYFYKGENNLEKR